LWGYKYGGPEKEMEKREEKNRERGETREKKIP